MKLGIVLSLVGRATGTKNHPPAMAMVIRKLKAKEELPRLPSMERSVGSKSKSAPQSKKTTMMKKSN